MVILPSNSGDEREAWVATQHKAFVRWINTYLEPQQLSPIQNLRTDISNGVRLIQLLEIIGGETLGRYAPNPRLRVQKAENLNIALDFIKHRGIQLYNIGAEDVIDGNLKLILGLIWMLILRFTIAEISAEGLSAKEGLLLWCQRKTAGYPRVKVQNFTTSWTDGLAFCALLDKHRPDLIDYNQLDLNDHKTNMKLAFKIASEEIGIPQIIDVEDICDVKKPDERSIMTYVAYWFHAFSALDKIETAGRRLERFCETASSALSMQSGFEKRMKLLLESISNKIESWNSSIFSGDYKDARFQYISFQTYKTSTKREWITEKSELNFLLGIIRTKLATYGLKEYTPPPELSLENLDNQWRILLQQEGLRSHSINEKITLIKEELKEKFAEKANYLASEVNELSMKISQLDGELETQLLGITQLNEQLKPLDKELQQLKELKDREIEANIEENDHTVFSYEELEYEMGLVKNSVVKKLSFIENQIVARSMNNLSPIQLEEFESIFRYFDKSQQNCLHPTEFSGALASLGIVYSEDEMDELFSIASNGNPTINFEQFINFMVDVTEDQQSSQQVLQSFIEIANGKPYVTELDLQNSLISPQTIQKLEESMPVHETGEGYDFLGFMSDLAGLTLDDVDDELYWNEGDEKVDNNKK